jgi:ketosteroid isomerase-like protein
MFLRFLILIFLASLAGLPAFSQQREADTAALWNQLQQRTEAWRLAYNSGDAGLLAPLYTDDAVYTSGHVPGLVAAGKKNVIAYFQQGIRLGGSIESVEILSLTSSCELVILLCRYRANNAGERVEGRNLLVLKRVNGEWLIATHATVTK